MKERAVLLRHLAAEGVGTTIVVGVSNMLFLLRDQFASPLVSFGMALIIGVVVIAVLMILTVPGRMTCNPAVTLFFVLLRVIRWREAWPLFGSQILGTLASVLLLQMLQRAGIVAVSVSLPLEPSWLLLIVEIIMALIVLLIALLTLPAPAYPDRQERESVPQGRLAAMSIGIVVALTVFLGNQLGILWPNPACALGLMLLIMNWQGTWIALAGPLIAVLCATGIVRLVSHSQQRRCTMSFSDLWITQDKRRCSGVDDGYTHQW